MKFSLAVLIVAVFGAAQGSFIKSSLNSLGTIKKGGSVSAAVSTSAGGSDSADASGSAGVSVSVATSGSAGSFLNSLGTIQKGGSVSAAVSASEGGSDSAASSGSAGVSVSGADSGSEGGSVSGAASSSAGGSGSVDGDSADDASAAGSIGSGWASDVQGLVEKVKSGVNSAAGAALDMANKAVNAKANLSKQFMAKASGGIQSMLATGQQHIKDLQGSSVSAAASVSAGGSVSAAGDSADDASAAGSIGGRLAEFVGDIKSKMSSGAGLVLDSVANVTGNAAQAWKNGVSTTTGIVQGTLATGQQHISELQKKADETPFLGLLLRPALSISSAKIGLMSDLNAGVQSALDGGKAAVNAAPSLGTKLATVIASGLPKGSSKGSAGIGLSFGFGR